MADIVYQAKHSKDTAVIRADCHLHYCDNATRNHKRLSLLVVILSAVTGTAIFASIFKNQDFSTISNGDTPINWFVLAAACLSVLNIVLSALQRYLQSSEVADTHKKSAGDYKEIKIKLESFLNIFEDDIVNGTITVPRRKDAISKLDKIKEDILKVEKS